jgi:hypothetical protein
MSGISVKNSQANCSPGHRLHITVKDRPTVVKMKEKEGGREGRPNGQPAGSYNTECGCYFRKSAQMEEKMTQLS